MAHVTWVQPALEDPEPAALDAARPKRARLPIERFMRKVRVDNVTGCWHWLGYVTRLRGRPKYGQFGDENRKVVRAHRWSFEYHVGPIPSGYEVDHLCRVPYCVNPEHLEAVTPHENTRRSIVARGASFRTFVP